MNDRDQSDEMLPGFYEALAALRVAGRSPPRALADAVLRHGPAAVAPLCALLSAPETWQPEALPEAMFPIHLIHLLGCLEDPRATPTLVEVMQTRDLGDCLTEGMASVLGALGPEAIAALETVVLDHDVDPFVRNAAGRGLYLLGCGTPEVRGAVVVALTRAIREADLEREADFSTADMLADDALRTGDRDAVAAVKDAFERGLNERGFSDASIIERLSAGEAWQRRPHDAPPIAHFETVRVAPRRPSPHAPRPAEALANVKAPERAAPRIGRNDPCRCGSGKKFKKCCGR